MRAFGFIFAQS